jgi:hypothetical protein
VDVTEQKLNLIEPTIIVTDVHTIAVTARTLKDLMTYIALIDN